MAGRFNIWYAGALLVAGATAVALLTNNPSESASGLEKDLQVTQEQSQAKAENVTRVENREVKKEEKRVVKRRSPDQSSKASANEEEKRKEAVIKSQAEQSEREAALNEKDVGKEELLGETDTLLKQESLVVNFTASETMGCAPLRVEFSNSSVDAITLSWNFGNGEFSEESDPVYVFEKAGIYAVALTAFGAGGDSGVFYQVIRVYPAPVAGFEMGEGLEGLDGNISVELMNYSTGAYSYYWEMLSASESKLDAWSSNEFQPAFNNSEIPEDAHLIRMVALNEHGCTDTAVAELTATIGAQRSMSFPTVFSGSPTGPTGGYYTPNDLRLDVFHPHYSEQPAEYHLRVYSKMGEVIFETRDILQGWDGYYMEEGSASGVYLWVATGTWQNGATFNLRGDVTLLWNDRL